MRDTDHDYIEALPLDPDLKKRIRMTVGCTDSRSIPKVPQAGATFQGPNGCYQLMHNGVKVFKDYYYGRWMTEVIRLLKGHHEPQEEKVFHEIVRRLSDHAVMVELGSFWAYYSLWFQCQVPGARNYLIEPDPNNLEVGRRNFALNAATGNFFNYSIGRGSSPPEPFECESDHVQRAIPRISVDDFMARVGLDRVDVLSADIQGAELEMLNGAVNSMERGKIRFVILSTHHHYISEDPLTHQKCLQFLKDRQAHILAAHNVTESFSGDGLIAASFWAADRQIPPVEVSRNHPTNSFFRELEYDLHEVWQALVATRQELRQMTEQCAELQRQLECARSPAAAADIR